MNAKIVVNLGMRTINKTDKSFDDCEFIWSVFICINIRFSRTTENIHDICYLLRPIICNLALVRLIQSQSDTSPRTNVGNMGDSMGFLIPTPLYQTSAICECFPPIVSLLNVLQFPYSSRRRFFNIVKIAMWKLQDVFRITR